MVIWISISISSLIIFILIIQISTVITIYYEHIIVTVIVIFNHKFYSGVNISNKIDKFKNNVYFFEWKINLCQILK